ncbi:hypothetical protein Vadar_028909 [Vaccinium darrowii]|uniref:Uncharacterized protein n=1 Tax=Vaccinium darrowii TaxID=229202 RepID=A0ACB7X4S5_9ERIC|nr:hypothetical protein Vadar_028909 [Vaccinium darrowii]
MEELLCDAAMKGDRVLLHQIIAKDEYILDKVSVGSFKGKNPLHVAISTGKEEFVGELLQIKPSLAETLDVQLGVALHIASAKGNLEIVKALVAVKPEMCLARDRDGNNPLHIAAMKGKVDVLKELIRTGSQRAKVKVDRGDTTLHLCVKYNQFQCLKLLLHKIRDPNFVNDVDADGNTILHLALFDKRWEMIEYVLDKKNCNIDVNAANKSGRTALDVHLLDVGNPADSVHKEIKDILLHAGAKPGIVGEPSWMTDRNNTFIIVASLIATMAFQAGVNPPGGVWQDDSAEHQAGKAILAYKNPDWYFSFILVNTIGFLSSLSVIVLPLAAMPGTIRLIPSRVVLCWFTLVPTAFAYSYSVIATFPKEMHTRNKWLPQIIFLIALVIFWAVGVTLFLLISWLALHFSCPKSFPNQVGRNQSDLDDVVIQPPQPAVS